MKEITLEDVFEKGVIVNHFDDTQNKITLKTVHLIGVGEIANYPRVIIRTGELKNKFVEEDVFRLAFIKYQDRKKNE